MRIFLDANVLFSAANAESAIAKLVSQVASKHQLVTSNHACHEARRNLAKKRPAWLSDFDSLVARTEVVENDQLELDVELVAKDRPILAAAVLADCDYLVTGDAVHFGHLYEQKVGETTVIPVRGMLALR